jgi:hypothetical protein
VEAKKEENLADWYSQVSTKITSYTLYICLGSKKEKHFQTNFISCTDNNEGRTGGIL